MLISAEDLKDSFVCPVSGQRLERTGDGSFVTVDRCYRYPTVNGLPVLVDFERSVLRQEDVVSSDAASAVQRRDYGAVGRLVKHLIGPPKRVTRQNVDRLLYELRNGTTERTVLIVGGGKIGQCMAPLYDAQDVRIAAFDVYASENIQVIADGHQIPFADSVFDAVIVQAVLEHVLVPQTVVGEIYRVLRPGGLVYAETPFLQQVHEGPYDFSRFTESGHRYLFRDFDLVISGPSAGPGTQMLWSIEYLVRSVFRSRAVGKLAKVGMFWVQYLDLIIPLQYQVDSASGVFFLGRKNGATLSAREIIDYYRGAN